MKSDGGQSSFSVLLFQDIAVIPMLALIPLLAMPDLMQTASEAVTEDHEAELSLVAGLNGWQTAGVTIGAIAVVIFGGSFLTGPVFRFIAAARLRELFVATALMMVVGIALLMSLVGLSPALGTFLAGVVLANSEYRHELESDIDPFKGLLLGLFFMTVGAGINFALLSENLGVTLALTFGLIALKIVVLLVLAQIFKLQGSDKWLFGLGLAQAGEFGFVLLSFTVANNVIPTGVADQLLLVVALSMLLTPLLFILHDRVIVPRSHTDQDRDTDTIEESNHIIIAGHGRVGGIVARMLRGAGVGATVIDFSAAQIDMLAKFGFRAYFGDATRPDLLHSAGIEDAKVLVIAIDGKDQTTELVHYVHMNHPHVHIIARAVDRNHVYDLYAAGCRDIIRETYDSSLRMGRSLFEALGHSRQTAEQIRDTFDEMDRKVMIEMAEHYDPDVRPTENEAYMTRVRAMSDDWQSDLEAEIKAIIAAAADTKTGSEG